MRERIEQTKKADGPLGIRTSVWLIVFGLVLACVLTIGLSRHPTRLSPRDPTPENLANQDPSTLTASVRRTTHRKFTPVVSENGASYELGEDQLSMIEEMTQDRRTWIDDPQR